MSAFRYAEFAPGGSLAPWVRAVWRLDAVDGRPLAQRVEAILPDGCCEVVVHLAEPFAAADQAGRLVRQEPALVVGPTTRAAWFARGDVTAAVGIRLEHGAARLLGLPPAHELRDRIVPAQDVGSRAILALADRVRHCAAADPIAGIRSALQQQLDSLATRGGAGIGCVQALRRHGSVAHAAASLAMSTRQFERVFANEVGVAPARLRGVWRFQAALREIDARPGQRLADVAQRAGFADEAHLCREFRRHAGSTVREYLRQRGDLTDAFLVR